MRLNSYSKQRNPSVTHVTARIAGLMAYFEVNGSSSGSDARWSKQRSVDRNRQRSSGSSPKAIAKMRLKKYEGAGPKINRVWQYLDWSCL